MTLHLVEIEVDLREALQFSGKGEGRSRGVDPGYHLHAWLAGTFGPGVLQPFRLIDRGKGARVLGYATEDAAALEARVAQFATPSGSAAVQRLRSKVMPNTWPEGARIGFELRAVPSVRLARAVEGRAPRGGEVDAYLAALGRGRGHSRAQVGLVFLEPIPTDARERLRAAAMAVDGVEQADFTAQGVLRIRSEELQTWFVPGRDRKPYHSNAPVHRWFRAVADGPVRAILARHPLERVDVRVEG